MLGAHLRSSDVLNVQTHLEPGGEDVPSISGITEHPFSPLPSDSCNSALERLELG